MEIHLAPLQGYTDHLYRRLHARVYGAVDCCYTPFIRVEGGAPRRQDMTRLLASAGDVTNLVPQVIFRSFQEFRLLARAVMDAGCSRLDLNLGCPFPMQTRKGRGAAMIADLGTMRQVAEYIAGEGLDCSVKMRLGLTAPDQWRVLMPVLNSVRLRHVAVHPRVASQMYDGELFHDEFADLLAASANPVVWNGGISTPADIDAIRARYPAIRGVMIGRGMLARPSLAREWREGAEYDRPRRMDMLLRLHDLLFEAYTATLCGDTQILQKIKPFWDYLEPETGHRAAKLIRKASTLRAYHSAVDTVRALV